MGTKENKVGDGTIILEFGHNHLVVVDVPYDASAPLPIPIPGQTTTIGAAICYQVLWPAHLVSIHTPVLVSKFNYQTLLYPIYIYIQLTT